MAYPNPPPVIDSAVLKVSFRAFKIEMISFIAEVISDALLMKFPSLYLLDLKAE